MARGSAGRAGRAIAAAGVMVSVGMAGACGPSPRSPGTAAAAGGPAGTYRGRPVIVYVIAGGSVVPRGCQRVGGHALLPWPYSWWPA
jgi:hypothetical protein